MELVTKENNVSNGLKAINSKFGILNVDINKKIYFPRGIIGFESSKNFVIANFPFNSSLSFKIMQSLDDENLSFIIMPYNIEESLIDINDIEKSASLFKIPLSEILVLFIVSIYKDEENKTKVTINLRAPLFVNTKFNLATQYVFLNNKYPLKHEIH